MKKAPTALAAGRGPDGEPLVYAFYDSMVRRILQDEVTGKPIETWKKAGEGHRYPFSAQPIRYSALWPELVEGFDGKSPVGTYRRDEKIADVYYTFHALQVHNSAYRLVSWHHQTKKRQEALKRDLPQLPSGFTLTAACEASDSNVLLWGKTAQQACIYCVWNPSTGLVGKPVTGPVPKTVTAAFLGYDKSAGERVTRLYADKSEHAFTAKRKGTSYVFTPASAPQFLAAAEKG
ncbi:hypothetical protein [Streptomyces sp. UNOB3_S3]|uniref:hypothetical protein n=1 Tax=Streptomyces sp. UNOB3_S3 TaxID=2871682 RepID=UPI001E2CDDB1|nr:hypothetical protein [Streptomyces sp. UNOB3_S3]MCC3776636.1 hypothetical protein [Streptomyces sp. UNOB3_S3]